MKRRIIAAVAVAIAALCVCAFPAHALATTPQEELSYLEQEVYTQGGSGVNRAGAPVGNVTYTGDNGTGNGNGSSSSLTNTTGFDPSTAPVGNENGTGTGDNVGSISCDGNTTYPVVANTTFTYPVVANTTFTYPVVANTTGIDLGASNSTYTPTGNGTFVPVGNVTHTPAGNSTEEPKPTQKDLSQVAVAKLKKKSYTYTGANIKPEPTVQLKAGNKTLTKNVDYTLKYNSNKNAGTGYVCVSGKGNYTGEITVSFTIARAANKITSVTKQKTLKIKALKKKGKQQFYISASVKGKAKKTFKKVSVSKKAKKYIKVSSAGKVTVKKGIKKGTYKLKVKVTAHKTANYRQTTSATKTITIYIK